MPGLKSRGQFLESSLLETVKGFFMTYTDHTNCFHLGTDNKIREIIVCSAINDPGNSKSVCNAYPATYDLKSRVENLNGADFYLIPVINAGEGNN